jgi:probable F420-dependent oxidoreductase
MALDFGLVLQCDPPASRLIELAKMAEDAGFSTVWTFDSVVLWQEPFVIYSRILEATDHLKVGTMVTNPLTRDWSVTASLFATLNDMFGNRTICGIGRGDSAVRVIGGHPATLGRLEQAIGVIRDLAEGREVNVDGASVHMPWVRDGKLPVWMAAYGPKALDLAGRAADGLILQIGDPFLIHWAADACRASVEAAGRSVDDFVVCAAAPAYVGKDLAHQRDQVRWFGGMVGNHVADLVNRYGSETEAVPKALTDYIAGRKGYDYRHHGRAGNPDTEFVPDDVVDRFCILGDVGAHRDKLAELADQGVGHFGLYLMHDDQEGTLRAYGEHVIPHFR